MAVVTVKSQAITDQDASPRVAPQAGKGAGSREKYIDGLAAVANGDSIGSKYLLARVPSNIYVKELMLWCPAITTCAADFGVYYASRQEDIGAGQVAGAVITAAFFAAAQSLAAVLNGTQIITQTTYTLANRQKPLWEALGLTSDPGGKFDIVATLTAAAASAGSIYIKANYTE